MGCGGQSSPSEPPCHRLAASATEAGHYTISAFEAFHFIPAQALSSVGMYASLPLSAFHCLCLRIVQMKSRPEPGCTPLYAKCIRARIICIHPSAIPSFIASSDRLQHSCSTFSLFVIITVLRWVRRQTNGRIDTRPTLSFTLSWADPAENRFLAFLVSRYVFYLVVRCLPRVEMR